MKYQTCDWLGKWKNFESYINSDDPYLEKAWQDAEAAAGKMPMFQGGAKKFWQKVCVTVTPENPHVLGGWNITAADAALCIEWLAEDGTSLGSSIYHLNSVLEKVWKAGKTSCLLQRMLHRTGRFGVFWRWSRCRSAVHIKTAGC